LNFVNLNNEIVTVTTTKYLHTTYYYYCTRSTKGFTRWVKGYTNFVGNM